MNEFLEFLTSIDFPYSAGDVSEEACLSRRDKLRELHPVNAVALATELAIQFRNENEWCQKGNNSGACLLAADELIRYMKPFHIRCISVQFGTYNEKNHAWLEVWDKVSDKYVIIDPTADQFGDDIPEVVVGFMEDLPQYAYEECI